LDGVVADVRAFCGGATQSDDMTIVVVRYDGP
jgi:serine phosphatase RsbU (regulator of sigma subunit)